VALNYDRAESRLVYAPESVRDSLPFNAVWYDGTGKQNKNREGKKTLWRWFILAALLFLIAEMSVLKFWK
jgi:hypothetical protein